MKLSSGAKIGLMISTQTRAMDNAFNANTPAELTISKVDKGVASVSYVYGPTQIEGKSNPKAKPKKGTGKINMLGKIVQGDGQELQSLAPLSYPTEPKTIGDRWTAKTNLYSIFGTTAIDSVFRLVSVKKVGNREIAEVAVSMVGTGTFTIGGSGSFQIRCDDGLVDFARVVIRMSIGVGKDGRAVDTTTDIRRTK